MVVEPIQGEGGFIVPAPGFLKRISEFCRERGILVVADEVQTGIARTGAWFASESEDFVPDIITTAKGLAGGMPLAAVTGRADVNGRRRIPVVSAVRTAAIPLPARPPWQFSRRSRWKGSSTAPRTSATF